MFTIGDWVFAIILVCIGGGIAIYFFRDDEPTRALVTIIITLVVVVLVMVGIGWYNTHTAAGERALKDYHSNMNNGIDRTLQVVADDGLVLYEREGKFDIEVHDNYIVFDENGVRTILYRSLTTTLVIEETE